MKKLSPERNIRSVFRMNYLLTLLSQCYVTTMFYSAQSIDSNKRYKPAVTKNIRCWLCCTTKIHLWWRLVHFGSRSDTLYIREDIISELHWRGIEFWILFHLRTRIRMRAEHDSERYANEWVSLLTLMRLTMQGKYAPSSLPTCSQKQPKQ